MTSKEFKKKWENYWYHHKFGTWVGIIIVFALIMTGVEISRNIKCDTTVTYLGMYADYAVLSDELEEHFSDVIEDVDKNGDINVNSRNITPTSQPLEGDLVFWQQIDLDFVGGDSYLYFVDETVYNQLKDRGLLGEIQTSDGPSYYIDITENECFKDLIYSDERLYLCVRKGFENEENESVLKTKEIGEKILEKILENN